VRLESRHEADWGTIYPICLDGDGSCPPEDCGGMPGFLARREACITLETSHDFAVLADFVDQLALKRSTGASIDAEEIDQVREALERLAVRQGWQGKPFSRKDVNERLRKAEYLNLMHQQWRSRALQWPVKAPGSPASAREVPCRSGSCFKSSATTAPWRPRGRRIPDEDHRGSRGSGHCCISCDRSTLACKCGFLMRQDRTTGPPDRFCQSQRHFSASSDLAGPFASPQNPSGSQRRSSYAGTRGSAESSA
jgi:hypothetical protein